ncbi:hypothetical protein LSUB1_G004224, partial [Lachnellula subtilissima]
PTNPKHPPPELHLLISSHLTYPDALSLKHTSRHFYTLVYTGVNLKIEWLIERRTLHLDCPHDKKCELGSDMRFCRGSVRDGESTASVTRERAVEDAWFSGRGFEEAGWVVGEDKEFYFETGKLDVLVWWMCLAVMGALLAWFCMEVQKIHVQPLLL